MEWWSQPYSLPWWGALIASFLLSASVTWLSIRYAHRRNLIDQPGQRRSHSEPTPRGGGVGIVVAIVTMGFVQLSLRWRSLFWQISLAILLAVLAVAALGWMDDHRPLSVRLRLAVQFLAASALWLLPILWMSAAYGWHAPRAGDLIAAVLATLLVVWSINLHNFMDGINGLLACQAIFVFVAFAWSAVDRPSQPLLVLAAAVLGFLPFNFPRARVFMGDVGSYALGLLIPLAAVVIGGVNEFEPPRSVLLTGAIASSGFVVDATCNLGSRMLRGKRWYSAHREHLYQWMVRSGMSHARVVGWYMGWNLVVVTPILWLLDRIAWSGDTGEGPAAPGLRPAEIIAALAVYSLGVALWIFGKRWCLNKVKSHRHA